MIVAFLNKDGSFKSVEERKRLSKNAVRLTPDQAMEMANSDCGHVGFMSGKTKGSIVKIPVDNLPALKSSIIDAITHITTLTTVLYKAHTFQVSPDIQRALSAGAVPKGFYWLDIDNVKVSMTFNDLQGLALAILTEEQVLFDKRQVLKAKVKAAKTEAELSAIKIV